MVNDLNVVKNYGSKIFAQNEQLIVTLKRHAISITLQCMYRLLLSYLSQQPIILCIATSCVHHNGSGAFTIEVFHLWMASITSYS